MVTRAFISHKRASQFSWKVGKTTPCTSKYGIYCPEDIQLPVVCLTEGASPLDQQILCILTPKKAKKRKHCRSQFMKIMTQLRLERQSKKLGEADDNEVCGNLLCYQLSPPPLIPFSRLLSNSTYLLLPCLFLHVLR